MFHGASALHSELSQTRLIQKSWQNELASLKRGPVFPAIPDSQ
jgi:hypothetical protein